MIPVWLEVHVDDVRLAEAPEAWPDAAALLDRLASVAEEEGGRLSFRVREKFARGDRSGFLRGLVARGHEVGAHAHRKDLAAGVQALCAAGIHPTVFAPGFVQSGPRGWRALARQAQALGCTRLTDRVEARHWPWQGFLAWERLPGVVSLDVSVSPFDWGVLRKVGTRVEHTVPDFDRLAELTEVQRRQLVPPGYSGFFGATFHEHNVADAQLRPLDLDGLRRYCARFQPVQSGEVPVSVERVVGGTRDLRSMARRRRWNGTRSQLPTRMIPVGTRQIRARRVGPARPEAALVVVHAGESGLTQGLGVLGLPEDAFPTWAVWTYERSEGPRTPGNPDHAADAAAVLAAARQDGAPIVLLSWSGGVVPALHVAQDIALFVDVEGPADRFTLTPPQGNELSARSRFEDEAWAGMEATRLAARLSAPYLRIQGTHDHQHGAAIAHARQMVAATGGRLLLLPGRVWDANMTIRDALQAELRVARR